VAGGAVTPASSSCDRQAVDLTVDGRRAHEGLDEAALEFVVHIGAERLDHVVLDEIHQPAGADDRDVGGRAAGDVGGEPLLQIGPGDVLDDDVDIRVGRFELLGHRFEDRRRLIAVMRDNDPDFGRSRG